jgi:SAM-dependent MidA family methyltransferase
MSEKKIVNQIRRAIAKNNGWLAFDDFMYLALYGNDGGYYVSGKTILGRMPDTSDSDFVTAPEISPLFGQAIARALKQALAATDCVEIWEFGAGTGALAAHIMEALAISGTKLKRYCIMEVSGALAARQRIRLARAPFPVVWHTSLPTTLCAVVIGNEVLDAMPVKLLFRDNGTWFERGVTCFDDTFAWHDQVTALSPPFEVDVRADYLTELHLHSRAFIQTLARTMERGAAFFIDYGFPEREYYHVQRNMGTIMCHQRHKADDNPLLSIGEKDITAHVNFTDIAVAAQNIDMNVLGYTSQAHFLFNCGFAELLGHNSLFERSMAQKLVLEHEMGELFKVIGLVKGPWFDSLGFSNGDRTDRL